MNIQQALVRELKTLADPDRARQQQAYMKSSMPFWGVQAKELRQVCKLVFKKYPCETKGVWLEDVAKIWDQASRREERHAAIELLAVNAYRKPWLDTNCLPLLKRMIKEGAWWDYVDAIAINHVGYVLAKSTTSTTKHMYRWAQEKDLWVRRSAILSQLKFKADTDEDLLSFAIENSLHDKDFFARKAIGWALRDYSRTNTNYVIEFVTKHREQLPGLSKREAYRIMLNAGTVTEIP